MNPAQDALKSALLKLNELLQLSIENSSGAEQKVSTAVVQLISMVTTASHAVRTHHQEQADIQQKLAGCVTELEKISRAQGKELKRLSSKSFHSVACNTETIFCSGCASKEATIKLCNEQLSIARDSVTDLTHKLRVSKTLLQAQQVMLAERNGFRPNAVQGEETESAWKVHPEPHVWPDIFSATAVPAVSTVQERTATQRPRTTHALQPVVPCVLAANQPVASTGLARPPLPPGAAPPHRYHRHHRSSSEEEEEEGPEHLEHLRDEEGDGGGMHRYNKHDEDQLQDEYALDDSGVEQEEDDDEEGEDRYDGGVEELRRYSHPHPHSTGAYSSSRHHWKARAGGYNPGGLEVDVGDPHGDAAGRPGTRGHQLVQVSGDWEPRNAVLAYPPDGHEANDSYSSMSSAEDAPPRGPQDRSGDLNSSLGSAEDAPPRGPQDRSGDLSLSGGSGRSWIGQGTSPAEERCGKLGYSGEDEEEESCGDDHDHDEYEREDGDGEKPGERTGLRAQWRDSSWAEAVQGGTEDSFAMVQNYYAVDSVP